MRYHSFALVLAFGVFAFLSASKLVHAQPRVGARAEYERAVQKAEREYKVYFQKPRTPLEYWAAIDFEIDVGKFDVAAVHITRLLILEPKAKTDEDLLKVETVKGLSHFTRMRAIRKWFDSPALNAEALINVNKLLDRLTAALENKLSDPVLINKWIDRLEAPTPEERAFAFLQLRRSKDRASPYLINALRESVGEVRHERLKRTILRLHEDVMTPFLEALKARTPDDFKDVDLRLALLHLVRKTRDERAIPYLWHMGFSPRYPQLVRDNAKKTLATLIGSEVDRLPDPRRALTSLAERFALHRAKYPGKIPDPPKQGELELIDFKVPIWPWTGAKLDAKRKLMPSLEADYYFALRYAREALDLSPDYEPAQRLMLKMLLEQQFHGKLDQFVLNETPKEYHDLLSSIDTDLLLSLLDEAMNERNLPVILPLVRVLGQRGATKAALPTGIGTAHGLLRALYYPNRRVQFEAAKAVLHLPGRQNGVVATRVVNILQRFLATETRPKALLIQVPKLLQREIRAVVAITGHEPVFVLNPRETFAALHESADVDIIVVHYAYPSYELPYLIANLRKDADAGLLPVILVAEPFRWGPLDRIAARYNNVLVIVEGALANPAQLKTEITKAAVIAKAPKYVDSLSADRRQRVVQSLLDVQGAKFTAAERKRFSAESMDLLHQMALGKFEGYHVRPAMNVIFSAAFSEEEATAQKAIEAYARFSGGDVQKRLAGLVLNAANDKRRATAAKGFVAHVQKHGLALSRFQLEDLRATYANPKTAADVRRQLALVVGELGFDRKRTGTQLRDFQRK